MSEKNPVSKNDKGVAYEITPEQEAALAPYKLREEVTVKRSPKSGGGYERSGWHYSFFDPQTQKVVVINDSLKKEKKVSLKTFLEWQKQDSDSQDSQEPKNLDSLEEPKKALNASENIWQSVESYRGVKDGEFMVGGKGFYFNDEIGKMQPFTIKRIDKKNDGTEDAHIFYEYDENGYAHNDNLSLGLLYTETEKQKITENDFNDFKCKNANDGKSVKIGETIYIDPNTNDTEYFSRLKKATLRRVYQLEGLHTEKKYAFIEYELEDSQKNSCPLTAERVLTEKEYAEKKAIEKREFRVGDKGYYFYNGIGVMQPFIVDKIKMEKKSDGTETKYLYFHHSDGSSFKCPLDEGSLYTIVEHEKIKEEDLHEAESENKTKFKINDELYIDTNRFEDRKVWEMKKVTIKRIYQFDGTRYSYDNTTYIKYQFEDGSEGSCRLFKVRVLTKEEYEKKLEAEERALKTYNYLDQELNENKTEKFIKICKSLSELNLYNLLTKNGVKIENKVAEKILRKSTLSLAIAVVLAGSAATVGAASLGASLPFLMAAKRFFAAGGSTVLAYGGLRELNKLKNKNLFLDKDQLKTEIQNLKDAVVENTKNNETEEAEEKAGKEGIFSKTKKGVGQYFLKRKIKKLEESDDSKILRNEIDSLESDEAMKKLTDMQAQRAAALMLDGWNKERIVADQTYRNIEILLEEMKTGAEKDNRAYLNYLSQLQELKEQAWQKNFKREQHKQWGHLIGAAAFGIFMGTRWVKDYHDSQTGYFNRTPSEPELSASGPTTNVGSAEMPKPVNSAIEAEPTEAAIEPKGSAETASRTVVEEVLNKFKELYMGQMVDATIEPGSGDGVIEALKFQIRSHPEKFGFTGDPKDAWDWASDKANKFAQDQGYGNIGVRGNKAIAYVLEPDNHGGFKIVPRDPSTREIIGADKINSYEYKIPKAEPAVTQPEDLISKENPPEAALGAESVNPPATVETNIEANAQTTNFSDQPAVTPSEELTPKAPTQEAALGAEVGHPPVTDEATIGAQTKLTNFPEHPPEHLEKIIPTAEITDANLLKFDELIQNINMDKISHEQLSQMRTILTAYGKENLMGAVNNINYYNNPSMATRAGKLFAQAVSQSREALMESLSNPLDKTLSAKEALEGYIYSLEHSEVPEIFERWVPAMNPETGEVFNILKHGKIGGEIEYWLDDNGSGFASKIFNTKEQIENFLTIKKPTLVDLAHDIHNKETIANKTGKIINATISGDLAKNIVTGSREIAVDLFLKNEIPDVESFFEKIKNLIGADLSPEDKNIFQRIYERATTQNKMKPVDKVVWFAPQIELEIDRIMVNQK
ncbi:MAG TPA: hypothetical protein PLK76_02870 [bacterium]|nr:hypothetical protein [bacterium]